MSKSADNFYRLLRSGQLEIGDNVEKESGYKFPGEIVAKFKTLSGEIRYVVECTVPECSGMLHIYNGEQLELIDIGEDHD